MFLIEEKRQWFSLWGQRSLSTRNDSWSEIVRGGIRNQQADRGIKAFYKEGLRYMKNKNQKGMICSGT